MLHLATWSQFFMLHHISPCNYWTVTEHKMCQPNLPVIFLSYSSKKSAAVFSVFHQSCTWKDLSLYLRMFSNWLPSTVSAGELHSLFPWHSHVVLPSGLPFPVPSPSTDPCFPCSPSACQTRRCFRCIYNGARSPHKHSCPCSWKLCPWGCFHKEQRHKTEARRAGRKKGPELTIYLKL